MFHSARLFAATLCAAAVASVPVLCVPTDDRQPRLLRSAELADTGLSAFQNVILPGTIDNDRLIRFGGIGSDIFRARGDSANEFWMVTDRGPNGQPGGRRTFPVPEFNPTIVHVKVKGDRIELLEAIPILNPDRSAVTGLPNVATFDETPWNYDAPSCSRPIPTASIPRVWYGRRAATSGRSRSTVPRSCTWTAMVSSSSASCRLGRNSRERPTPSCDLCPKSSPDDAKTEVSRRSP
jgi:hypothetical protein